MMKKLSLPLTIMVAFFVFANVSYSMNNDEQTNVNPEYHEIDRLLTETALEKDVPPEIVKGIAYQESSWHQFIDGEPNVSSDGGIGIMQVTNNARYDDEKLKYDIEYNIEAGIDILLEKKAWSGNKIPQVNDGSSEILEHWYFSVMAYNGLVHSNSPIVRETGETNDDEDDGAYQEKIFNNISKFNNGMTFATLPIKLLDLDYKDDNQLGFNTLSYDVSDQFQPSRYYISEGDLVITTSRVNVRESAASESSRKSTTADGEILKIIGEFVYDESHLYGVDIEEKQFPWYHVERSDGSTGYVAAGTVDLVNVSLIELDSLSDKQGDSLTDIADHWAKSSISNLNKKNIISGYTDGTFQPDENISRGEVMAMITRTLSNVPEIKNTWTFADVVPPSWAEGPINTGVGLQIIGGYPNNEFRYNDQITRAELVVILDRLVTLVDYQPSNLSEVSFKDDIPDWAEESVMKIAQLGIVGGFQNNTFRPGENATRAQLATVMERMLK